MTFTSSPGFSLMLEGISYMIGAELPGVFVNVMRGGPGLGNIAPEQADIKLACRGLGHGNTHGIVLAPSTPQEMLDLTMLAFELSFKYRNPVVVLCDGYLGQMTGKVELPTTMLKPGLPEWAVWGDAAHRRNLISSIQLEEADLEAHNLHLDAKYAAIAEAEQRADLFRCEDAEVLVVACNTPARMAKGAVETLRAQGVRAGLFRPLTLWPFPVDGARAARSRRPSASWWSRRRAASSRTSCGWPLSKADLQLPPIDHVRRQGGVLPQQAEIVARVLAAVAAAAARGWRHERLLRALRAPRPRRRPEGPEHALLPGLRPRPRPQVPRRRDPGARDPGPHDRGLAGRLQRLPVLLPRRRQHAGRARARPGGGARAQAREPRVDRDQLPGRRRPRLDRPRRDRERGAARASRSA